MIGPTITFSIVFTAAGASSTKRKSNTSLPSSPMNPASRNPIVISFHSIAQSSRKLAATSDHAAPEVAHAHPGGARHLVLVLAAGPPRVLAGVLLESR
jgi:hypothetical protein